MSSKNITNFREQSAHQQSRVKNREGRRHRTEALAASCLYVRLLLVREHTVPLEKASSKLRYVRTEKTRRCEAYVQAKRHIQSVWTFSGTKIKEEDEVSLNLMSPFLLEYMGAG